MSLAVKVRDASKQFGRHELSRLGSARRQESDGIHFRPSTGELRSLSLRRSSFGSDGARVDQEGLSWQSSAQSAVQGVDHISFSVRAGEICALVGPSGSGKSTLVRLLAAQILPDSGEVIVFGWDTARRPDHVRRLANRVAGDASFFPRLSALENLLAGIRRYGGAEIVARQAAFDALDLLGFDPGEIHRPMESLSPAGQQQVALARALLARPALLLLDEPGRNLDPAECRRALAAVKALRDSTGATVIIATRNEHDVQNYCDRMVVLERGAIYENRAIAV